jgi:hypothetical protein
VKARLYIDDTQEVSAISRGLKALAKELKTPVIAVLLLCASGQAQINGQFISYDIAGAIDIGPTSIAPGGKIVGVYTSSDGHQYGFLLSTLAYQTIDFPGSTAHAFL